MRCIWVSLLLCNCLFAASSDLDAFVLDGTKKSELHNGDALMQSFDAEFSEPEEDFDPLQGYNEVMTQINDRIYVYAFNPLARTYKKVMPKRVRGFVNNFFHNIYFPIRFTNNAFQGKAQNCVEETGRFFLNTTLGLGGLFDPASNEGLIRHDEDFGQTLGYYGVGSGFHIVLPVLGPSNLRDFSASFVDGVLSPIGTNDDLNYRIPESDRASGAWQGAKALSDYSYYVDDYEKMKKEAIDLYHFYKNVYEQRRERLIAE